jgi:hypothetical protein
MKHNKRVAPSSPSHEWIWTFTFLIFLLALPVLACTVPVPDIPLNLAPASPTPELAPTPEGDTLSFLMPAHAITLRPGESVPGTRLMYVGRSDDAYEVSIDGSTVPKRQGDSFFWSGVVAPGVYGNYNLRLTTSLFGGLPVAGPVELVVLYPNPLELTSSENLDTRLHYNNIVLDYRVPVGSAIPGTMLHFEGIETQGLGDRANELARLGGRDGYPYIAVGDSLVWIGKLRENVAIRYNLRVLSLDESIIHLVGTGELWITN